MKKFEIIKNSNGKFQFNLKAGNGQVILTSKSFKSKSDCLERIELVKANALLNDHYEIKKADNGQLYFHLKDTNGRCIGKSFLYESMTGCEAGVLSVKHNAPNASISDIS